MEVTSVNPFNNVPAKRHLPFYNAHGALDEQKVAGFLRERLSYKNEDLAKTADVSVNSVRFDRIPQKVHERFLEIANIFELVAEHFDGDIERTVLWFNLKNPLFGNIAPKDLIRFGRYKRLLEVLMDFKNGQQA
jgi:hypothetical protein